MGSWLGFRVRFRFKFGSTCRFRVRFRFTCRFRVTVGIGVDLVSVLGLTWGLG